jgi:hypothetical protein
LKEVKKHSAGQVFHAFQELRGSLPCSQNPAIASYPEKIISNAHHHALLP